MKKGRASLMVVDDDGTIRALLETALAGDYEVLALANGPEAARALDERRPDLLLLDINAPGADGHELCRAVRAEAEKRRVPVLFMTASKDAAFLSALQCGAGRCIAKPFDIPALRAKIEPLLER